MAAMQCRPLAAASATPPAAFQLLPNPAAGPVTVRLPTGARGTAQLLNARGQLLREVSITTTTTLTVAGLPGGLYLIRWSTPDGRSLGSRPLMVQ